MLFRSFSFREGFSRRGAPLRLTAVTVVILLLVINMIGWGVYFYAWGFLDDQMGQRLTAIAKTARLTLPNLILLSYTEVILPRYLAADFSGEEHTSANLSRYSREAAALLEILEEIKKRNDLEEVFLINRERQVMLSTNKDAPLGREMRILMMDRLEIEEALSGTADASTLYSVGGRYFRRGYAPVYLHGETIGAIGISAPANFFNVLDDFRRVLYLLMGLSLFVSVGVSVVYYRMAQAMLRTQQELERSSRLAERGHMAASVAHEIRNPLSIISGTVDVLEREHSTPEVKELYDYLHDEIKRLNRVVTNFLKFGRPSELKLEEADVNGFVERTCEGVEREFAENGVALRRELDPNAGAVRVDTEQMQQVLLNVILNAYEAVRSIMPEDGEILVKTERRNGQVVLSVIDNGPGISQENLAKIFDPFFTTRSAGSGLGLSIVESIVRAHGGRIEARSDAEKETVFEITLNADKK